MVVLEHVIGCGCLWESVRQRHERIVRFRNKSACRKDDHFTSSYTKWDDGTVRYKECVAQDPGLKHAWEIIHKEL